MSKTLFNSELVKRGPSALKVLSDVRESKFQGKPDYMFVELDGQERTLSAENPDYLDPLILHKGDVVTVTAEGKGDSAKLTVSGGNGEIPASSQAQPPKAAKPASDSKPQAGSTFVPHETLLGEKLEKAIALLDAKIPALVESATPDARLDAVLRLANSLFIQSFK